MLQLTNEINSKRQRSADKPRSPLFVPLFWEDLPENGYGGILHAQNTIEAGRYLYHAVAQADSDDRSQNKIMATVEINETHGGFYGPPNKIHLLAASCFCGYLYMTQTNVCLVHCGPAWYKKSPF